MVGNPEDRFSCDKADMLLHHQCSKNCFVCFDSLRPINNLSV